MESSQPAAVFGARVTALRGPVKILILLVLAAVVLFTVSQRYLSRNCSIVSHGFQRNCTILGQESKLKKQDSQEKFHCFNKGAHLNDWDYLIRNVLHTWHIYENMDMKSYGQAHIQGWTELGPIFSHYLKQWVTNKQKARRGMLIVELVQSQTCPVNPH